MKKFLKKLLNISLMLCILLLPVYGLQLEEDQGVEIIEPMFTNINFFQNSFQISSKGKASVSVYLSARNADQVKVVAYLQQYKDGNWKTVKRWSESRNEMSNGLGEIYYLMSGYSYRLRSYGYVYLDGNLVETTNYISETKVY